MKAHDQPIILNSLKLEDWGEPSRRILRTGFKVDEPNAKFEDLPQTVPLSGYCAKHFKEMEEEYRAMGLLYTQMKKDNITIDPNSGKTIEEICKKSPQLRTIVEGNWTCRYWAMIRFPEYCNACQSFDICSGIQGKEALPCYIGEVISDLADTINKYGWPSY